MKAFIINLTYSIFKNFLLERLNVSYLYLLLKVVKALKQMVKVFFVDIKIRRQISVVVATLICQSILKFPCKISVSYLKFKKFFPL